jgi:hypothetical protein
MFSLQHRATVRLQYDWDLAAGSRREPTPIGPVRNVPEADVCLSSYPVKGLRGLTGVLDEKFRDRAERAVL